MLDRLPHVPTPQLAFETGRLERRLIDGIATGHEIDVYVALAGELGRRALLPDRRASELDGILDPRD